MFMKEFELLKIIEEEFCYDDVEVPTGTHDATYVKVDNRYFVFTCDTVNEKSDFPPYMCTEEMGHMALAVTLSDLAACGSKPLYFLNSISLREADENLLRGILRGIKNLAAKYGVKVLGGDIDFSDILTICGFAVGEARRIITRGGAVVGERVYVTDKLGKAQLSLDMLLEGSKRSEIPYPSNLYTPEPRIKEGMLIANYAGALTDISDSLAVSLHQVAERSNVRIIIEESKIPLDHLTKYVDKEKALELFIYGGGDYELLFTAKKSNVGIEIGYVEDGEGVYLKRKDGYEDIEFRGYTHF